jgi:hypothetical protein
VEGAGIGCCWAGGVVVVDVVVVGPVGLPNMASMVGRSAAPKGVERKSEGKSNRVNIHPLSDGALRRRAREKRAFDP